MRASHQEDWLDYAWQVVACPSKHLLGCASAGGVGCPGEEDARFPGFVGARFEPGNGVLCLGHVHRYIPDKDDIEGDRLAAIEKTITAWRRRGRNDESDAVFLAESRVTYQSSAPTWDYWARNYQPLLSEARYLIDEIAFANVAKCRTVTEEDSGASYRLAQLCSATFPPERLITLLQPAAVPVASLRLNVGDAPGVQVVMWNGRTGVNEEGNAMRNWLPFKAGRLRKIRRADS